MDFWKVVQTVFVWLSLLYKSKEDAKFKMQVSGAQVPVVRYQVSGFRCAGSRCQVPGVRFQVSGISCLMPGSRCQVPAFMCHFPGIRDQISAIRSLVKMSKTLTLKTFYVLTKITNFSLLNGN